MTDVKTTATPATAAAAGTTPQTQPLNVFVFGATGRTGVHYVPLALARGHNLTLYLRDASKLPATTRSHERCKVVTGALDDTKKVAEAIASCKPHVTVSMLASDPKPHTAISDATRSFLQALSTINNQNDKPQSAAADKQPEAAKPQSSAATLGPHFIAIAGWGLPPSQQYMAWADKAMISVATWFYSKPAADMMRQLKMLDDASAVLPLHKQTIVLPPLLTDGKPTGRFVAGDMTTHHALRSWSTVARADMAAYILALTEQAAAAPPPTAGAKPALPRFATIYTP
jgi:hypothetical protein